MSVALVRPQLELLTRRVQFQTGTTMGSRGSDYPVSVYKLGAEASTLRIVSAILKLPIEVGVDEFERELASRSHLFGRQGIEAVVRRADMSQYGETLDPTRANLFFTRADAYHPQGRKVGVYSTLRIGGNWMHHWRDLREYMIWHPGTRVVLHNMSAAVIR